MMFSHGREWIVVILLCAWNFGMGWIGGYWRGRSHEWRRRLKEGR